MTNISLIFLDPTSSTNTFIIKGHYFWEADRNCKYTFTKTNTDSLKDDQNEVLRVCREPLPIHNALYSL